MLEFASLGDVHLDGLIDDAVFTHCGIGQRLAAQLWDEVDASDGEPATVVLTMSVPTDDVIFCIFTAASCEVVAVACEQAGLPAERVAAAMVAA